MKIENDNQINSRTFGQLPDLGNLRDKQTVFGETDSFQYETVSTLKEKIADLTEINRNLLNSLDNRATVGRNEILSLYQMLYIDDYKKKVKIFFLIRGDLIFR